MTTEHQLPYVLLYLANKTKKELINEIEKLRTENKKLEDKVFRCYWEKKDLMNEVEACDDRIEELEENLKEESTHYCCGKCDGCKKCGDCECDEEENEVLKKRIRELENDSSCKNCGSGEGRVGCGKDCFQDSEDDDE